MTARPAGVPPALRPAPIVVADSVTRVRSEEAAGAGTDLTTAQRETLLGYARTTWASFVAMTDADGKVTRWQPFETRAAALKAAGLSE